MDDYQPVDRRAPGYSDRRRPPTPSNYSPVSELREALARAIADDATRIERPSNGGQ